MTDENSAIITALSTSVYRTRDIFARDYYYGENIRQAGSLGQIRVDNDPTPYLGVVGNIRASSAFTLQCRSCVRTNASLPSYIRQEVMP